MRRLGVRVPHGAPMKIVLRQKSYFYCKNIKSVGTRTQRSASPPSFACGYAVRFALRIACCSPGKKAKCSSRNEHAGDERQMRSICLSPSCLAKTQKTRLSGSNCRQSLLDYHYPRDFSFILGQIFGFGLKQKKIDKKSAYFLHLLVSIFASFFIFRHAKVSPTFMAILALPRCWVYLMQWFSFATPNIRSMVSLRLS